MAVFFTYDLPWKPCPAGQVITVFRASTMAALEGLGDQFGPANERTRVRSDYTRTRQEGHDTELTYTPNGQTYKAHAYRYEG